MSPSSATRRSERAWALVALVTLLCACYQPAIAEGQFSCSVEDPRCPAGYACDPCSLLCVLPWSVRAICGDAAAPPDVSMSADMAQSLDMSAPPDIAVPPDISGSLDMIPSAQYDLDNRDFTPPPDLAPPG